MTEHIERRSVLLGIAGAGAAGLLAACGGDDGSPPSSTTPPAGSPTSAPPTATSPGSATTAPPGGISTSQVPVGGGTIVEGTVITQPTAGTFKAFNGTCTHQQCQVAAVANGVIRCPCHGSEFRIADGSVARGPATRPLAAKTVTVNGDTLTVS